MPTTPEPTTIRHQNPADDIRVTVDRLAAIGPEGRPVVTIKFTADPAMFDDEPIERWASVAVDEALRRHQAERARTRDAAIALDRVFRDRGL